MKYLIIIEKAGDNFSAYLPDVLGCVATGDTLVEAQKNIEVALKMHLRGLAEDGLPIPEPLARAGYVILHG